MSETNCCKVGRVMDRYALPKLHDRLRIRQKEGGSLRELATFVNKCILESSITEADASANWDVDIVYRILTDDHTSAGRRTEVRSKLINTGIDVAAVEDDFVSHITVRTHFRQCLNIETSRTSQFGFEDAMKTIEWARSRDEAVIKRTLDRLGEAGLTGASDLDVTHSVRVMCDACGQSYRLRDYLARQGCECGSYQADDEIEIHVERKAAPIDD